MDEVNGLGLGMRVTPDFKWADHFAAAAVETRGDLCEEDRRYHAEMQRFSFPCIKPLLGIT